MQSENLLRLISIIMTAVSYVFLLLALTVIEEERSFYIFMGLGGIIGGVILLGLAKIIQYQVMSHHVLEESLRAARTQNRLLQELLTRKNTAKKPATAQQRPQPTQKNKVEKA